jgi:carbamoyl-phosphate synthase large subunit
VEGYVVVLVNSNPVTIMTDSSLAHRTYIEPMAPPLVEHIIDAAPRRAAPHHGRPDRERSRSPTRALLVGMDRRGAATFGAHAATVRDQGEKVTWGASDWNEGPRLEQMKRFVRGRGSLI